MTSLVWKTVAEGVKYPKAVSGGKENDEKSYVVRAEIDGELALGKRIGQTAYIPQDGEEHAVSEGYEILANEDGDELEWASCNGKRIPRGAVEGGLTKTGGAEYVGRAKVDDMIILGKVVGETLRMFYPLNGKETCAEEFEVLCVKSVKPRKQGAKASSA